MTWYIADEPAGQGQSPEYLETAYEHVKQLDPYRPVVMVFMPGSPMADYLGAYDIVMIDPYPIPYHPVTFTADSVDSAFAATLGKVPVWTVPQSFGGNEGSPRGPTAGEMRTQAYLALIHGSQMIQFFIRSEPSVFPKSPLGWAAIQRAAMETSILVPAYFSIEEAPAVTSSPDYIDARAYLDKGLLTIVAVNTENQPVMMNVEIEGSGYSGQVDVPFAFRQVQAGNGIITDPIDAHGTRVYQIAVGPMPQEDLQVAPNNLTHNPSWETMVNPGPPANCYVHLGEDLAATALLDPLEARHERYSLRLVTPTQDQGVTVSPYWVGTEIGYQYRFSVWAKTNQAGTQFWASVTGESAQTFNLTNQWQEYEIVWVAGESKTFANFGYNGPGKAWFDLMQIASQLPGDFEPDGDVDIADLAFLLGHWLDACSDPSWCDGCDLNKNSWVDLPDLAKLAEYWVGN